MSFLSKNKTYIFIFICTICATLISLFSKADVALLYKIPDGSAIRGFPFHFIEYQVGNFLTNWKFDYLGFLVSLFFWFLCVISIWRIYMEERVTKLRCLVVVTALTFFLFYLNVNSDGNCVTGFPLRIFNRCTDVIQHISIFEMFVFKFVNFVYWFLVSLITVNFFHLMTFKSRSKFKYLVVPLLLVCVSVTYNPPCHGFFCLSMGAGFPLGYLDGRSFSLVRFLIDLLFIAVTYFILINVVPRFLIKNNNRINT